MTEERISEFEDTRIEITQTEAKIVKRGENKVETVYKNIKPSNIHIIGTKLKIKRWQKN